VELLAADRDRVAQAEAPAPRVRDVEDRLARTADFSQRPRVS
jgi:hypothetical protein